MIAPYLSLITLLFSTSCAPPRERTAPDQFPSQSGIVSIIGNFDRFTTDEMGNIYALTGDVLELYDKQGRFVIRNSVKTFGRIASIDATFSLKPMVFSPEQGLLAVLDNTLSVQGSVITLSRQFPQVVQAAMSVQNNFWLFDERELSILRVDGQLRPLSNTGRLDQLLGFTPRPTGMHEHDGWLYVNDPLNGILVFDLFGTYARTIPITGILGFQVRGQEMYFFKDGGLHVYDMQSFETRQVVLPQEPAQVREARIERGIFYTLLKDRITTAPVPPGQ
jgi:hypothetical protein